MTKAQATLVAEGAATALMRGIDAYLEVLTDLPADVRQATTIAFVSKLTAHAAVSCALLGTRCVWGIANGSQPAPADGTGAMAGPSTGGAGESLSGPSPVAAGTTSTESADTFEAAQRHTRAVESDVIGQLGRMLEGRVSRTARPTAPDQPA